MEKSLKAGLFTTALLLTCLLVVDYLRLKTEDLARVQSEVQSKQLIEHLDGVRDEVKRNNELLSALFEGWQSLQKISGEAKRGKCDDTVLKLVARVHSVSKKTLTLSEQLRMVRVESQCDPLASNGDSVGLMQGKPSTVLPWIAPANARLLLFVPLINLVSCIGHLDDLMLMYHDKKRVLRAYRLGIGDMLAGKVSPEADLYVERILNPLEARHVIRE